MFFYWICLQEVILKTNDKSIKWSKKQFLFWSSGGIQNGGKYAD